VTRRRWAGIVTALLLLAAASGCGSSGDSGEVDTDPPPARAGATLTVPLGDRPFQLHVPESYRPDAEAPLVVLLHGFTSSAAEQESYFQLTGEADRRGFWYAMPDGTVDPDGERFWNATEACCDFHDTGVDDTAYLRELIDTVTGAYPVDADRVYLVGHSNGGFMAYRMACEHAEAIAGVVSLAGSMPDQDADCQPGAPVSVLQIHGTADRIIPFDGGANFGNPFPSAETIVSRWRAYNGCSEEVTGTGQLDLETNLPQTETSVTTYAEGCAESTRVSLWSIVDGSHVPQLGPDFGPAVLDFLDGAEVGR
jgi:polyhydroxybutyrate depolymerase